MLEWLVGGDEERAVLLHNYLAALNYEVYILLGMAVPEGETAFVLYRNKTNQTMRMINPTTGMNTNASDPTCALQQVWALFNQNNVSNFTTNHKYILLKKRNPFSKRCVDIQTVLGQHPL